jgi:hypothetical protein
MIGVPNPNPGRAIFEALTKNKAANAALILKGEYYARSDAGFRELLGAIKGRLRNASLTNGLYARWNERFDIAVFEATRFSLTHFIPPRRQRRRRKAVKA